MPTFSPKSFPTPLDNNNNAISPLTKSLLLSPDPLSAPHRRSRRLKDNDDDKATLPPIAHPSYPPPRREDATSPFYN